MSTLRKYRIPIGLLVLALFFSLPWLNWAFQPTHPLKLLILDKTVPDRSYREHAALIWSLNHFKIPHPEHPTWVKETDYLGYTPENPVTKKPGFGEKLKAEALKDKDLLFIADSYGVYSQDEAEAKREKAPDYSRKLYGGLDDQEVDLIENFLNQGKALIAEFNTFASPTRGAARKRLEKLLNLNWTEWSGRYFEKLEHPTEIPAWARRNWKQQSGSEWNFKGPGYLLVNENSRVVVLEFGKEVLPEGLRIYKASHHPFMKDFGDEVPFYYWFDILKVQPGSQVLAEYRLNLTDQGHALLKKEGIPAQFPAIVLTETPSLRLYLAGDASDSALDLGSPSWSGRQTWFKNWPLDSPNPEQIDFFWRCYIPLMRNVYAYLSQHYSH